MTGGDIEAVERATLAAVAPRELTEIDGWLLGLDPGTIRRAASAVPLVHDLKISAATLDRIEAAYNQRGLNPAFRLADQPGLAGVRALLAARGYAAQQPTLVKFGSVTAMRDVTRGSPAETTATPPQGWAEVFLGEGFDPIDGANRIANLTRSPAGRSHMRKEAGAASLFAVILLKAMRNASSGDECLRRSLRMRTFSAAKS